MQTSIAQIGQQHFRNHELRPPHARLAAQVALAPSGLEGAAEPLRPAQKALRADGEGAAEAKFEGAHHGSAVHRMFGCVSSR